MWQLTCSVIVVCFLVVSGCKGRSYDLTDLNPIDCSRLNKVVLCEAKDPFGTELILQPQGKVIMAKSVCDALTRELRRNRTANYPPFSGILCYQVFLDSSENVLLVTHVVDFESIVVIDSYHGTKTNNSYIVKQEVASGNIIKSDRFVRTIRQVLEER